MLASLLLGLDSYLQGSKVQILASETLPTAAKAYSHLLRSSLGQNSALSSSSTYGIFSLDSSGVGRGNTRGGFRGGSSSTSGGGRTIGQGDRK